MAKASTKRRPASIIDACNDPALFKKWFKKPETFAGWLTFMKAMFGLEMTADEQATFSVCTQRIQPNPEGYKEAWVCVGRRGGKSLTLALIAVYLAAFVDWSKHL